MARPRWDRGANSALHVTSGTASVKELAEASVTITLMVSGLRRRVNQVLQTIGFIMSAYTMARLAQIPLEQYHNFGSISKPVMVISIVGGSLIGLLTILLLFAGIQVSNLGKM